MFGDTRGRQIWRKIKHETIVFIFMTDELMDRKNWTRQKLIGDHWLSEKSLGAVEGLFIFTPTEIVTISGTKKNMHKILTPFFRWDQTSEFNPLNDFSGRRSSYHLKA